MKRYIKSLILASLFGAIGVSTLITATNYSGPQAIEVKAEGNYTNGDAATYYTSIKDKTGDELLSALRSLNSSRRKATVGYSAMGTSPSGSYKYTDYDTSTVQYDSNGQPYGTKIISFYSGNSTTSFNREHVWPNSHGGNVIENDIHMPRPTIQAENGSRGNSFYVEGKCSGTSGWDPAMENFGDETYRGDSARIIFYCMLVDTRLQLIEADSHSTSNSNKDYMMGRLSHMLKWNINYAVADREMRRNEGAEYLQGNRNPFIDHPEYACKIWGNTNDATKEVCKNDTSGATTPTDIDLNTTAEALNYNQTLQLSIASVEPEGASTLVTWSSSNSSIASVNSSGLVTAGTTAGYCTITATSAVDASVKATCQIYVQEPSPTAITGVNNISNQTIKVGKTYEISASYAPANAYPAPTFTYSSSNTAVATVSNTGVVTGVSVGESTITVTASQSTGATKSTTFKVTVEAAPSSVTVSMDSFSSTSGNVDNDENITYEAAKGTAGTAPIVNGNQIRVYQNGGLFTVSANNGHRITKIVLGSAMNTTVTYKIDGGSDSSNQSISAGGKLTLDDISATSVVFKCKGTTSSTRLYVNYLEVEYDGGSSAAPTLEGIAISGSPKTAYAVNDTFVKPTVIASYSNGSDVDVTNDAVFSGYNMNVVGNYTVVVSYQGQEAQYTINVKAPAQITGISVSGTLTHTSQYEGKVFDYSGITVNANKDDSTSEDISDQVVWSPNPLIYGTNTITGTYLTYSVDVNVSVIKKTLTSIAVSNVTTNFNVGDVFTYDGTCIATYNSGVTSDVKPVINSSAVNMNAAGTYTVGLSYTEGGVTKTTSYQITVSAYVVTNTIKECYSKSANASCAGTYGIYVGSPDGASSVIMNGEYGILLYKQAPQEGWEENETCLYVSAGTLSIYKNLYEISYVTVSEITDKNTIKQNVLPISTYTITGSESADNVQIASRICAMRGTISSITHGSNNDSGYSAGVDNKVNMLVNGHSILLFVKGAAASQNLGTKLNNYLTSGEQVAIKGYSSFYTTFQVQYKEIIEASGGVTYTAQQFALDLMEQTEEVCTTSSNKESDLRSIWLGLELNNYILLSDDEIDILRDTIGNNSGSDIERAIARYDFIVAHYASLDDFIERGVVRVTRVNNIFSSETDTIAIVTIISVISITTIGAFFYIRKRKED